MHHLVERGINYRWSNKTYFSKILLHSLSLEEWWYQHSTNSFVW